MPEGLQSRLLKSKPLTLKSRPYLVAENDHAYVADVGVCHRQLNRVVVAVATEVALRGGRGGGTRGGRRGRTRSQHGVVVAVAADLDGGPCGSHFKSFS